VPGRFCLKAGIPGTKGISSLRQLFVFVFLKRLEEENEDEEEEETCGYSYLSASMGLSREAFRAG
jgi:hypothetical protein